MYMQSNPRLSANVPVILAKILANLLVKLTKLGSGAMGGANPSTKPSSRLYSPPKEGGWPKGPWPAPDGGACNRQFPGGQCLWVGHHETYETYGDYGDSGGK